MFRNFSFEAASRHASAVDSDRACASVSPTSTPDPPSRDQHHLSAPPAVSIGELALRFGEQNLEVDPRYQGTSFFDPSAASEEDFLFSTDPENSNRHQSYASLSPAAIRQQRQANMRLQCSASHAKDISSLVERMVNSGDQCVICTPRESRSAILPAASGFEEDDYASVRRSTNADGTTFTLRYRRSGEILSNQACVSKNIRLRKKKVKRAATAKS
ncbi:hypothetical protein AOQ84DRAFT_352621 [Glonium stellatum]|uniref:Uncharacterized protein n=1 Tax=Glonium stellatum TaxID=574774 RepID=A0A8E2F8G4_9PEZI|nr:hypothetical protein AOQ84DRAFT_352621 [Glonium stellatum]